MMRSEDVEEVAAKGGYHAELCDMCHGRGAYSIPDANSPTGKLVRDPCDACGGNGRVWTLSPSPAFHGPRYSDLELLDLVNAPSAAASK